MLRHREIVGFGCCAMPAVLAAVAWLDAGWTGRRSTSFSLPLGRETAVWLASDRTSLAFNVGQFRRPPAVSPVRGGYRYYERLGFRCNWGTESRWGGMTVFHGNVSTFQLAVPNVLVLPLLLMLPLLYLRHAERGLRRARAGLCAACGYDLRATPVQCPECGASVTPPIA